MANKKFCFDTVHYTDNSIPAGYDPNIYQSGFSDEDIKKLILKCCSKEYYDYCYSQPKRSGKLNYVFGNVPSHDYSEDSQIPLPWFSGNVHNSDHSSSLNQSQSNPLNPPPVIKSKIVKKVFNVPKLYVPSPLSKPIYPNALPNKIVLSYEHSKQVNNPINNIFQQQNVIY